MPYILTYGPANLVSWGDSQSTASADTAPEAWALVQQLRASDEQVKIEDASGCAISWQELRDRAAREAN